MVIEFTSSARVLKDMNAFDVTNGYRAKGFKDGKLVWGLFKCRWGVIVHWLGIDHLNLGVSLFVGKTGPNLEIHLPGGFIRMGRILVWRADSAN